MSRIAVAAILLLLPLAAGAQSAPPARPQIATTKVDGTDNVYIFRNGNHQAMFIVTTDGVIATDPVGYGRPTGGQDYLAEIRKASAEMKVLAQAGKCWDTAEKEFKLPGYETWPGYAAGLPFIARRYCGLWGRGT